ncbi:MAG: histidinol-phosphate transaminase [Anaerolineae bacterium]|jgi:histidinol-phosphate aminotransferase|nr:histidinol-phosphate transaminase [Anaerolineae bacterium]
MNALNFVAKHIKAFPAYTPSTPLDLLSEELGIPVENLVKLDANENPFGLLPEAKTAIVNASFMHQYPDADATKLRRALADYHHVPFENIVVGAGEDELLDLLTRMVITPGDTLLDCTPTFVMYAFNGRLTQARIITASRNADFSLDIPEIERVVAMERPKMLILANPNNPTGNLTAKEDIRRLLELPVLVVVDEAYVDFAPEDSSVIHWVTEFDNLIVLRTFSKFGGLAGLRVGYGVFPDGFAPVMMQVKQPYTTSVPAQAAALATMQVVEQLQANARVIVAERDRFFQALQVMNGIEPYPSEANFILCKVTGMSNIELYNALRRQGILIRVYQQGKLSDCVRISIGTRAQMDQVIEAMKGILS